MKVYTDHKVEVGRRWDGGGGGGGWWVVIKFSTTEVTSPIPQRDKPCGNNT